MSSDVRTWPVERTYSDDKQNIIIPVHAAPDGTCYHRKERSLTSFESGVRDTYAAVDVPEDELGRVADEETRESYATVVTEVAESHEPTDTV